MNPAVLQDGNVKTVDVCALALSFVRKHYGLSVSQDFAIVGCSPNSSPDEIYRRLGFHQRPNACEQPVKGIEFSDLKKLLSSFLLGFFFCLEPTRPDWLQSLTIPHSESDPSRPSAADLLFQCRETRWERGGANDPQACREQENRPDPSHLHHQCAASGASVPTPAEGWCCRSPPQRGADGGVTSGVLCVRVPAKDLQG